MGIISDLFRKKRKQEESEPLQTDYKLDRQKLIDYVSKDWKLGSLHGMKHWLTVEKNGKMLLMPGVNPFVVTAFAFLHDSCRLSNGEDLEHGKRALVKIDEIRHTILKNFTDDEIGILKLACEYHTTAFRTSDITANVCFDADRLDLTRVGMMPDPRKMASPKGVYYAEHYAEFIKRRQERWSSTTQDI